MIESALSYLNKLCPTLLGALSAALLAGGAEGRAAAVGMIAIGAAFQLVHRPASA